MSHQIVYTPESQGEKRSNQWSMTAEQMKLLNAQMPLGFCLVPKGKSITQSNRPREINISVIPSKIPKKSESKSEYFEPIRQVPPPLPPRLLDPQMMKCMRVLTKLRRHQNSYPFNQPVDVRDAPDYLSIIKEPMDLNTIETNIQTGTLVTPQQFIAEVRKVWQNAYMFNAVGSIIYEMAASLDRYFNKLLAEEGMATPGTVPHTIHAVPHERPHVEKHVTQRVEPAKKKIPLLNSLSETPMTMQEKRSLGQMIKKLPHEHLRGVWEIVNDNQENREELEFDIETLPIKKARHLESYVKSIFNTLESKRLKEVTNQMDQASENESSFIIDSDGED